MTNIKVVAELAGVSATTVSRVLSGKSYVSDDTRMRVMDAIQKTGYSPNVMAKGLKMGRTNTIVLMLPDIQNLIFPMITRGVEDAARQKNYTVILCNTDENSGVEKDYISTMKSRLVDGFIVGSMLPNSIHIRNLRTEGFPLVLINRFYAKDEGKIDIVAIDNFKAAYNAVRHLIGSGHKKIALALGRENLYLYNERHRGYRAALEDHNIPYNENLVMREATGSSSFYSMTQALMNSENRPDAIFATSDPKAFVILHALHEMGIRIPEDVSVLSFDNVTLSGMVEPPLSTVAQPFYDIGVRATNNLIHQIQYKDEKGVLPQPLKELLETDLIIRASTR
jgi:LacI family transcriptional regulator